jgi:hypothetical protein
MYRYHRSSSHESDWSREARTSIRSRLVIRCVFNGVLFARNRTTSTEIKSCLRVSRFLFGNWRSVRTRRNTTVDQSVHGTNRSFELCTAFDKAPCSLCSMRGVTGSSFSPCSCSSRFSSSSHVFCLVVALLLLRKAATPRTLSPNISAREAIVEIFSRIILLPCLSIEIVRSIAINPHSTSSFLIAIIFDS